MLSEKGPSTTKDTLSIEIAQWTRILYYFRSGEKNDRPYRK
jgi:hypothetical protein